MLNLFNNLFCTQIVRRSKLNFSNCSIIKKFQIFKIMESESKQRNKKINKKKISKIKIEYESEELESKVEQVKVETVESVEIDKTKKVKEKWVPNDWQDIYNNIKQMRSMSLAPVDTMGCERTMEPDVEKKVYRYQNLLSLMLSSQTRDEVTFAAMERLKSGPVKLTIQKILDLTEEEVGEIIKPVGFWKKKSNYIKRTTQILRDKYDDDIPNSIEGLCSLPGVGQKMAYICMNVAWQVNAGIGVDTHVHRISNRLKWAGLKGTNTPDMTREVLESWLPKELWQEFNILLVGFGQTICKPIGPKCSDCLNSSICPFGKTEIRSQKAKKNKKRNKKGIDNDEDEESEGGLQDNLKSKYFKK